MTKTEKGLIAVGVIGGLTAAVAAGAGIVYAVKKRPSKWSGEYNQHYKKALH